MSDTEGNNIIGVETSFGEKWGLQLWDLHQRQAIMCRKLQCLKLQWTR